MENSEGKSLVTSSNLKTTLKKKNEKSLNIECKTQNKKIRYYFFDNYKGILIFTVVFGHFLWKYSDRHRNSLSRKIVEFIYFFHMPGFVFTSGFLTSENSSKISNAVKLLILYFIFNFSFLLITHFYINIKLNFFLPITSYWYLLSLFYWRIAIKYCYKFNYIFTISIIISLLIGYLKYFSNILSTVRTFTFLPFFISGYKIAQTGKFNILLKWRKGAIKFIIFIISFISFLVLFVSYINSKKFSDSTLFTKAYNDNNTIKERIIMIFISFMMILFSFLLIPNVKVPIIHKWGKNSLYIYLFHRIFTIIAYEEFFSQTKYSNYIIEFSILFSLIILLIFSSDYLNNFCNSVLSSIHQKLLELRTKNKFISFLFYFSVIFLLINPIGIIINFATCFKTIFNITSFTNLRNQEELNIKDNFKDLINNSIRISYIGDLILLKDQVIVAKNNITGKYEFDEMFKYTSKHFHESDLTIGVYEGPSAGNNTNYTTSNYKDGLPLYLNFPDEFAEAVKKAGINLVTTANNHLLDKGINGAMRTIDVLDKYNISHVGSYRNKEEKDKIFTINVKGIKIAVLAYTSIMNYYKMDAIYEKYNYLTRIIPNYRNKYYYEIYEEIKNDFIQVKKESPDIIVVLAHMGIQFRHNTVLFQDKWNDIFSDLGADIILGDHSHAVQPLQYIRNTLVINSPGNFANSYIKKDGDSTAIIDIYINKQNKKVIGASAIPMYTKEIRPRYFSAIPIYDLIKNNITSLTEDERKRVEEIQLMSTKVLVGKEFGINEIQKEYFFINNNYFDFNKKDKHFCNILNKYSDKIIYKYIENSKSITFIGDSITKGTKNGFHPWYEPMINCFDNKKIKNISRGSITTKLIIKYFTEEILNSKSDLYIIALGTNDIRYRNERICSMNSEEYIEQINNTVNLTKSNNSKYIFIDFYILLFFHHFLPLLVPYHFHLFHLLHHHHLNLHHLLHFLS